MPLVATNAVHYATAEQLDLACTLAAVRARRSLDEVDGWLPPGPSARLMSGREMAIRFARYPGAVAYSVEVAQRTQFCLRAAKPDLPGQEVPDGHTPMSWLRVPTASQDVREQLAIDVRRWSERTGTRAQIEAAGAAVRADSGAAWQLQRVVGELLTNVERHAQASEVVVRLLGMDDRLHLVVEDDGRGLPEDVLAAPTARVEAGHYGLGGLVERVGALEGSFHAGKREGGGARAEIVIPFGQHVGRTVEV